MATTTPEEALDWEARQGPRAAIAAAIGAVLVIAPSIAQQAIFADRPRTGFVDALARAGQGGSVGSLPSLRTAFFEFYDDRATSLLLVAFGTGLGFVAVALMLTYLGSAVRSRTAAFRPSWMYIALAGGVLSLVSTVALSLGSWVAISDFLDGPHTVDRAEAIGDSSLPAAAQLLGLLASFALGVSWVLICLNAMRVGLLTRFMGVLGVIAGATVVLPILTPVIQTFWLGAMALLLAGRWPNGLPPAWRTGEAVPWPSSAELRDARRKQMEQRRGGGGPEPEPEPERETAPAHGRPHPSSKKKRKRRA